MSDVTKKAIRSSFLKLLHEQPLNRITVKAIVNDCGMNRNTFYYYYSDIPHLLEDILDDEAAEIIRKYPAADSIEECLNAALEFALQNRTEIMHVYHSISRDVFEDYQWRICTQLATMYVSTLLKGHDISEEDRQIITDYVVCLWAGFTLHWMQSGMKDDVIAKMHRFCRLVEGETQRMIRTAEQNH